MGKQTEGSDEQRRHRATEGQPGALTDEEQRVFETIARLEVHDGPPTLGPIAREAQLSTEDAVPVVQRLMAPHDVVQELPHPPGEEDLGPRYRVKTGV